MGQKQKRRREAELQQRQLDGKRARPTINLTGLYALHLHETAHSSCDTVEAAVQQLCAQMRQKTSPALTIVSVISNGTSIMPPHEWNTELGDRSLQVTFTENKTYASWDERFASLDRRLAAQDVKIVQLQAEIVELKTEIKELKTENVCLKKQIVQLKMQLAAESNKTSGLQKDAGLARQLAVNECVNIANNILLVAARGWAARDGTDTREAFAALAERLQRKQFVMNSVYAGSFAHEAAALNAQRNRLAHPEPWARLQQQVQTGKEVYLAVKQVRKKCAFASWVMEHYEGLIPDEYKV